MSKSNFYENTTPNVHENIKLREPQKESFPIIEKYFSENNDEREIGIVLPVGCGKSGCITLAPFACKAFRTLVIAPNLDIADQLLKIFTPSHSTYFYKKCRILNNNSHPEPVEIRSKQTNISDLDEADIVITNIQQLQGEENHWLTKLPDNFFDLILFDEGHHTVADSWNNLKIKFPNAKIVNFSATPLRADGQLMAGKILYTYPIFKAIKAGYIKHLKAIRLNPKTLRYARKENNEEVEVSLDEVKQLGEQNADFRRSILTSEETLNTIVDASIQELQEKRERTREKRLKIIASALNYAHCIQIKEAYNARGLNADYVHSKEDSQKNAVVMKKLDNHELDVIVQVRKLGEGFDHPFLSVAAVFSIFSNLSPFVQFVGRIMRVIKQDAPRDILNYGTVIFHAGANIAQRWEDFQHFSEADQDYFDQLLPMENIDIDFDAEKIVATPEAKEDKFPLYTDAQQYKVQSQDEVHLEEIPLLDSEVVNALQLIKKKGFTPQQLDAEYKKILEPVPVTRQQKRHAKKKSLDEKVKNESIKILEEKNLSFEGHDLDTQRLNRSNFVVIKSVIDSKINQYIGKPSGQRHELSLDELNNIDVNLTQIIVDAKNEVFNVKN